MGVRRSAGLRELAVVGGALQVSCCRQGDATRAGVTKGLWITKEPIGDWTEESGGLAWGSSLCQGEKALGVSLHRA